MNIQRKFSIITGEKIRHSAMTICCVGLVILISGCVRSSGVMMMKKNIYSITTNGPAADAKKQAYAEAVALCKKDGKEISVLDEDMTIRNVFGDGTYELKFQCFSQDDPSMETSPH